MYHACVIGSRPPHVGYGFIFRMRIEICRLQPYTNWLGMILVWLHNEDTKHVACVRQTFVLKSFTWKIISRWDTVLYLMDNPTAFIHGSLAACNCISRQIDGAPYHALMLLELFQDLFLKHSHLGVGDRKSTRLNSSHSGESRMPSSA